MKLNTLQLNLAVGQEIAVGKHDDLAKITKNKNEEGIRNAPI